MPITLKFRSCFKTHFERRFCRLLLQILSEAERKNEICLSPERSEVEFFHFSKATLEFAKSGKQSKKGFRTSF